MKHLYSLFLALATTVAAVAQSPQQERALEFQYDGTGQTTQRIPLRTVHSIETTQPMQLLFADGQRQTLSPRPSSIQLVWQDVVPEPEPTPVKPSRLWLTFEQASVVANGSDEAVFTVVADGKPVPAPSAVRFYNLNGDVEITPQVKSLGKGRFAWKTTAKEDLYLYATYAGVTTRNLYSHLQVLDATARVPAPVGDPQPEKLTGFKSRALLVQFTGTSCPNCPQLIRGMNTLAVRPSMADRYVPVAFHTRDSHTFNPVYPSRNEIKEAHSVTSYPQYTINMGGAYDNGRESTVLEQEINNAHFNTYESDYTVLAARTVVEGNTLHVRAQVKANTAARYYIGAMVVEDGQRAYQSGMGEIDHDHIVRALDAGQPNANTRWYSGYDMGYIDAGAESNFYFQFDLDRLLLAKDPSRARVVLYVSTKNNRGLIKAINTIQLPVLNATLPYEYLTR